MLPHTHVVAVRPAKNVRWSVARGLIVFGFEMILLAMKMLEREHPTRVFAEGRISESLPAIDRSLCQGRVKSWLGEAAVGTLLLAGAWSLLDFVLDAFWPGTFDLSELLSL